MRIRSAVPPIKADSAECGEVCEVFPTFMVSGYSASVVRYLYEEVFCHEIYHFEASTRKPLIIDCGSNIGMSVLYFKLIFPESEIIAFEPNPYAFRLLEKNIQDNGLKDITSYNIALYDDDTDVFLRIGNNNLATPLAEVGKERRSPSCIRLSAKRLSHFIRDLRVIDLIKIDVEGAEANILRDLFESGLIRNANRYIVEFHQNNDLKLNLARFLEEFGVNGFDWSIRANPTGDEDILLDCYKRT